MKTVYLIIAAFLTFMLFFAGCFINVSVINPVIEPDSPSTIKLVAGALIAVYEVVVRIIPTIGDYSVVSWLIKALKKVSDTLNVSK